ncbi:MAG: peptide-methionine (S)-S-oxide reductase MsrA [Campylobacterota bacterium]|nr:peptide-methionine (S)-S-oxide reductase MsrA [Campylobacterota bacterium]
MIVEIVFAAGCFWGVEKHFENINGVIDVKSGYTGGNYKDPKYNDVLKYRWVETDDKNIINHTEAVKVKFDNSIVKTEKLIKSFWELHDPTQKNRQGNDVGNNYRSAIFFTNENQKSIAFNTKVTYQTLLKEHGYGKIVTQIKQLDKFYLAEDYHQDYLLKHPNGYCPNHSTGVKFKTNDSTEQDFIYPIGGKEIIVIESNSFCPYCEKLEKDVISKYNGTIPIRTTLSSKLKKFDIKTKLNATPIMLFIKDGEENMSHKGYMTQKEFYKKLGKFKLGIDTESYNVAFNKGTDNRYCKQYDVFKDTPDGIFVDKVSGDPLFNTDDRFNSRSGWLSFYKAVDDSVIEKQDLSYGMNRIEVIAKKSGIHLGHVFPRADGQRRFCINATVLEFVPKTKR